MRRSEKWTLPVLLSLALVLAPAAALADQVPVNIVYPINGGTYPKVDPQPADPISSVYQPFSFSVTCPGGQHTVEWGVDGTTLGEALYYDEFSSQFVMKIAGGMHVFWVRTDCGDNKVQFKVAGKSK